MNGFDYDEEKKRYADLAKDLSDSAEQFYQSLRNDMAHDEWARNSYMDSLLGELSRDLDLGSLPNSCRDKAGKITKAQVKEIATKKMPDMNCHTVEAAMEMVAGQARSMGIEVVE